MTFVRWLFKILFLFTTLAAILAGAAYYQITNPIKITENQTFEVKSGDNFYRLGKEFTEKGWLVYPGLMRIVAKLHPEWVPKVGQYSIEPGMSLMDIMQLFDSGKSITYSITLLEGKTLHEYLLTMAAKGNIQMTLSGLSNEEISQRLSLSQINAEGLFFANTYLYHEGDTDAMILRQANRLLESTLEELWEKREEKLPYKNAYQALIMASIIEKETGAPEERPLIARVFINRLQKGIKLQTDPTVIYGLGALYNGNLTRKGLLSDSPYNTYQHYGLPPTPIANVGKEAIIAALNPGETKALYFVAKGDGTHAFSNTLKEHNKAVAKYQKYQRRSDYKSTPDTMTHQ